MSAGGSALPCATPSSAPMPSFCICSRSRTSHSNWYSEAIVCAASATFEGVSRLAGSFTRPRVKFCASASMRPRATAPSSSVPEPAATTANASTDFLSSSVVYRSGSNSPRIAPSTAAAAYSPPACSASSARAIFFTDFDFKCRTAAPATLRNSAGSNFSTFPTPASSTRAAATPGGRCSSVNSRDFPATSPASVRSPAPKRASFRPSKTSTISAPVSIRSRGWRSIVIRITIDCKQKGTDAFIGKPADQLLLCGPACTYRAGRIPNASVPSPRYAATRRSAAAAIEFGSSARVLPGQPHVIARQGAALSEHQRALSAAVRDNSHKGLHGLRRAAQVLGRYRRRRRGICAAEEVRHAALHGAVPLPQRKDPFVYRPRGASVLQVLLLRRGRRRGEVRHGEGRHQLLRGSETPGRALRHSHAETLAVRRRGLQTARRHLSDARAGAGEFPRQSRLAGRGGGAGLPGAAGRDAGNGRTIRAGILGPLGTRAAAPLRAPKFPRGADGASGPGGQAAGRKPVRPFPQPADVPHS